MKNRVRLSLLAWIYIVVMILYIFGSFAFSGLGVLTGTTLLQFSVLVGIPATVLLLHRYPLRSVLRLYPVKISTILKISVAQTLLIPTILLLNVTASLLIQAIFGRLILLPVPTPQGSTEFLLISAAVALTPAFCEEILFRGVLLSGLESNYGYKKAAILSAVLFGLFHFNPQNVFGPIVLGLVFAYYVQVTGSILPAMFGHFVNNFMAVILSAAVDGISAPEVSEAERIAMEQEMLTGGNLGFMLLFLLFVLLIVWICYKVSMRIIRSLKSDYPVEKTIYDEEGNPVIYFTKEYAVWEENTPVDSARFALSSFEGGEASPAENRSEQGQGDTPLFLMYLSTVVVYVYFIYVNYVR